MAHTRTQSTRTESIPRRRSRQAVQETTVCNLCGNVNGRGATMCAWCETSLSEPFSSRWKPPAAPRGVTARDSVIRPRRPSADLPDWSQDRGEGWWVTAGNALVIAALVAIALACPVAVAILLRKQEIVDNAGQFYSNGAWHSSNEFPVYGTLSLIPTLTCALTVYLIFRWVTRRKDDEE